MKDKRSEPEAVKADPNAVEMMSVWIAGKRLHCAIKIGMYEDSTNIDERKAWGILLSDVIKHISRGLDDMYGYDQSETKNIILDNIIMHVREGDLSIEGKVR